MKLGRLLNRTKAYSVIFKLGSWVQILFASPKPTNSKIKKKYKKIKIKQYHWLEINLKVLIQFMKLTRLLKIM